MYCATGPDLNNGGIGLPFSTTRRNQAPGTHNSAYTTTIPSSRAQVCVDGVTRDPRWAPQEGRLAHSGHRDCKVDYRTVSEGDTFVTYRPADLLKTARIGMIALLVASGCAGSDDKTASRAGGRLIATYRTEPNSFNRLVHPHAAVEMVNRLTQASLVRLNRITRTVEPRLARSWTASPDGLTWTMNLVESATFSDGTPFTANDVLFSFRAVYDPEVGSPIGSSLMVDG